MLVAEEAAEAWLELLALTAASGMTNGSPIPIVPVILTGACNSPVQAELLLGHWLSVAVRQLRAA